MAQGKQESDWSRFSALMATIWNSAGRQLRKGKTFEADEFNPFAKKHRRGRVDQQLNAKESMGFLAAMFGVQLPGEKKA